ncbi:hypothetical protein AAVH_15140 [Aphelenchoides avenae]|nr:hypothetical protein AAVH_15140 [Aphelenchus avenae]
MVLHASSKANIRKRSSKNTDEAECTAKKPVQGDVCGERKDESANECVRFSSLKKLCRAFDGPRRARIPFFFFDTEYSDDLRPNPTVEEFSVAVDDDVAIPQSMDKLRFLLPNMKTLNITMESAYCWDYNGANRRARYAYGINSMCEKLERFLRADDRIETVRFDVLDTPGVALKKLKGFRRDGDKFVKKVRVGKKIFHASVQAPSQSSTA